MPGMSQDSPDNPVSNINNGSPAHRVQTGLTGRIKAVDGRVVEGAMVVPVSLEVNSPAIPEIAIISDANGQYVWPLPAGAYEVSVIAEGYDKATKRVTFSGGEILSLDFVLQPHRVP